MEKGISFDGRFDNITKKREKNALEFIRNSRLRLQHYETVRFRCVCVVYFLFYY